MAETTSVTHGPDHVEMAQDAAAFAHWPDGMRDEMLQYQNNGVVGSVLVSETDNVRVWHLHIAPGKRCAFHRHVNAYFWSSLADGKARGYFASGEIRDVSHYFGETKHFAYGSEDSMVHSVENIGDTDLRFCTVEFLDGPNAPLPIPDEYRLENQPAS
jgi:hypothetical protein